MEFKPLTQENAVMIANTWKYKDRFWIYDICENIEYYQRFIDPLQRENAFYEIYEEGQLFGYVSYTKENHEVIMEAAMNPMMLGEHKGYRFCLSCLLHLRKIEPNAKKISIFTDITNTRAMIIYRRLGFEEQGRIIKKIQNHEFEFMKLTYRVR